MSDWLAHIIFPLARWLHIVGTALLLGGTLFYEFVLPQALEDMRDEQQLAVIGRVRWVFRKLVWASVFILLVSGGLSLRRLWGTYNDDSENTALPWAMAHWVTALVSMVIALRLTMIKLAPRRPMWWIRVNAVLLLVAVFFASTARHVRLTAQETRYETMQEMLKSHELTLPTTQKTKFHE